MQKSGFSIVFCFVVICICVKEVWNLTTAKWEEFYSHFPVFRTYERGKTVTFQYSPTLPQTRNTTQWSILLCLFPSSPWGKKYPSTKCHSSRLVILFPVTQLASDTLRVRHVIRSCLDPALTVEEMPPPPLGLACDAVVLLSPRLSPARGSSLAQLLLSPLVAH